MANGRLTDRKDGLWARIKRIALTDVGALMRGLNADDLEKLERVLIEADFGVAATVELTQALEDEVRQGKLKTEADLRRALEGRLSAMLAVAPSRRDARAESRRPDGNPDGGVNGTGKTTTAAKLARRLQREGRRVVLAAADTYRAGAIAQLQVWAERLGILRRRRARRRSRRGRVRCDRRCRLARPGYRIVDTAGRLHTQEGLMEELGKVVRVIARQLPGAPHETLLVLDGTVGQNAVQQGRLFTGRSPHRPHCHQARRQRPRRGRGGAPARARPADPLHGPRGTVDDLIPFDPRASPRTWWPIA